MQKCVRLFHQLRGLLFIVPFIVAIVGKALGQLPNFGTSYLANGDEVFKAMRVSILCRCFLKRPLSTHLITSELASPDDGCNRSHRLHPRSHCFAGLWRIHAERHNGSDRCCDGKHNNAPISHWLSHFGEES